jgi:hypothetical protein
VWRSRSAAVFWGGSSRAGITLSRSCAHIYVCI